MISRLFNIREKIKRCADLLSVDWHYSLGIEQVSDLEDIELSSFYKPRHVPNDSLLLRNRTNGEIFKLSNNSELSVEITFVNNDGDRHRNNNDLPALYGISFNKFGLDYENFYYSWYINKQFYRENLKPHFEKYSNESDANLNYASYFFKYGHSLDARLFDKWVDEQGIDRNNITPEDEQLIKMKWA